MADSQSFARKLNREGITDSMGDSLRYQDCFEKRHMTCAVRKS